MVTADKGDQRLLWYLTFKHYLTFSELLEALQILRMISGSKFSCQVVWRTISKL